MSIITPTLNRATLLSETLASVASQTYGAVEHIVIDGGSADGTLELLRDWEARTNLRWMSGPDRGMYEAINKGLAAATGEFMAYLNSDDLYFPWTVSTIVESFRKYPDADLVFGDVLSVDGRTGAQRIHWQLPFDLDYIRRIGFLAQPAVFWRRSLIDLEGNFDESLTFVADCDFWMRIGERHRFQKVNEMVAVERNHDDALRERARRGLEIELETVRSRYVTGRGSAERIAVLRHRVRVAMWRRAYWLSFGLSRLRRDSQRPWRRFLGDPRTRVSARWLAAIVLPRIGRRIEDRILARSAWPSEVR